MNATVEGSQPALAETETLEGTTKVSERAPPGTTEAATAAQKAIGTSIAGPREDDGAAEMPDEEYAPPRHMEFVGVDADVLRRGLFNTVRVGRRWADLSIGEVVRLVCTDEARQHRVIGSTDAMVVFVATGEVHELIRGHSATNFSVRGEGNPNTRDLALAMEMRGHYNMGPDVITKGGTVVYFLSCDVEANMWGFEDPSTPERAGKG